MILRQYNIDEAIERQALKLIRRHELYCRRVTDHIKRSNRRSTRISTTNLFRPEHWNFADGFDPYLTRARKDRISRSIRSKIKHGTYEPYSAVERSIPKQQGGTRSINVFQVADSAVSFMVYRSLLVKNYQQFSKYSYAYRPDLTLHDAIRHMRTSLSRSPRMFVAQIDFKAFFDSITHNHIWTVLRENDFLVSEEEKNVIRAFLCGRVAPASSYDAGGGIIRTEGVPQGTSLSLFLSNVAATPIDRMLESLSVGFARYGDDTVIWSDDYGRVNEAVNRLSDEATSMGVDLNLDKSEGVYLYSSKQPQPEMLHRESVEFVGYSLKRTSDGDVITSMHPNAITNIKARIARLVYDNLIEPVKNGHFNHSRISRNQDQDYIVLLMQLRRYLYGDLTDNQIRRYMGGYSQRIRFNGRMAFYPLIADFNLLKQLDGWMLHTIHLALEKRRSLLQRAGNTITAVPHNLPKSDLALVDLRINGSKTKLLLPSFYRIGRIIALASERFGPNAIAHRRSFFFHSS